MKPSTWCSPVQGQRARRPEARRSTGAAPASRARVRNVFEVAAGPVPAASSCRPPAELLLHVRRAARSTSAGGGGGSAGEPLAGQPAGAERQRQRDLRAPRRCRPRSPASRRRCRAPAAARPTSRTSGARPGRSSGPRPRRRAPAARRRSPRGPGPAPWPSWSRRAPPRWRTRAARRRRASSAALRAAATAVDQRVGAASVEQPPSRPIRSASRSTASPSTPATGGRRGGRRPRADGRCWNRRRAHRAACAKPRPHALRASRAAPRGARRTLCR